MEKEKLLVHAWGMGDYLALRLDEMVARINHGRPYYIAARAGDRLMQRMTFWQFGYEPSPSFRDRVVDNALALGLFLIASGTASIRLMPPLTVSKAEIDSAVALLFQAIIDATEGKPVVS